MIVYYIHNIFDIRTNFDSQSICKPNDWVGFEPTTFVWNK